MKLFLLALALVASCTLSACGTTCEPHAAYTIPAHWVHAYYSHEASFSHYRYYHSCSSYYDSYQHRYRRSCTTYPEPVYHYYWQYHHAVYYPAQYVARVVCPKK